LNIKEPIGVRQLFSAKNDDEDLTLLFPSGQNFVSRVSATRKHQHKSSTASFYSSNSSFVQILIMGWFWADSTPSASAAPVAPHPMPAGDVNPPVCLPRAWVE
jgi:hypothetical protein